MRALRNSQFYCVSCKYHPVPNISQIRSKYLGALQERLHLAVKLAISAAVGALAIWAWYALTTAMGAPI